MGSMKREEQPALKYPVLIFGAGRGGSALLEMFLEHGSAQVVGIVDPAADAPGIALARQHGIPVFHDGEAALQACRAYPDCIVYNLSNDDQVAALVSRVLGDKHVATGQEAHLFWQMVTRLKQVKAEFERSQNHLQAIIHSVLDGIITLDAAGRVRGFNPAAERIFGYAAGEVLGQPLTLLLPEMDAGELLRCAQDERQAASALRAVEMEARRKGGAAFALEMSLSGMTIQGERYCTAIVRDITERKLAQERLAHLAHHDFLTGLPNRALFLDRLGCALQLAQREGSRLAVLFLDLDGFKAVNDTYGHEAGDALLQAVTARLMAQVRTSDVVARMGGDEFTFLLHKIGNEQNAQRLAEKIVQALAAPFGLGQCTCRVGGSVGICLSGAKDDTADALLRCADEAMYQAKQAGKNTWRMHGAA